MMVKYTEKHRYAWALVLQLLSVLFLRLAGSNLASDQRYKTNVKYLISRKVRLKQAKKCIGTDKLIVC